MGSSKTTAAVNTNRISTIESIVRQTHAESGSVVRQLTSSPAIHANIYMDTCYADASSRYIMYLKSLHSHGNVEVWRADLQQNRLQRVCEDVSRWEGICTSADQQYFYCARRPRPEWLQIIRIDIVTLDQVSYHIECPHRLLACCASVTPDDQTLVMSAWLGRPHRWGVLRLDLEPRTWRVIHEGGDELIGGNPIIDPGAGRDVVLQINRGAVCDDEGQVVIGCGEEGATLHVIDIEGGNVRPLPVGRPHTGWCGGHSSWAGKTRAILTNIGWSSVAETQERGSIAVVRPGDKEARIIGHGICAVHVNASRDGRFFVTDKVMSTPHDSEIVIGSVRTDRHRVLCEHGSSFGAPQYTHPHPWLTPDCKWVVFNSDRYGVPHVFAASIPEGLLEELDTVSTTDRLAGDTDGLHEVRDSQCDTDGADDSGHIGRGNGRRRRLAAQAGGALH